MSSKVNNLQVRKSNALLEASYRLSVGEQRIMLACISQIRRDEKVTDEKLYSVSAAEISKLSGLDMKNAYTELEKAALRLKRREVRLSQEANGKGLKPKVMITGWVQTIIYIESEGRVELRFSKDMLPYLTELSEQFTQYALTDVAKMNSAYAIRLYELLIQYQYGGQGRELSLNELRAYLQLEDKYPSIKDFKKRVIEIAVEQINLHSPIYVTWTQKKTGRRVSHFIFSYELKTKAKKTSKDQQLATKSTAKRTAEEKATALSILEQMRLNLPKG